MRQPAARDRTSQRQVAAWRYRHARPATDRACEACGYVPPNHIGAHLQRCRQPCFLSVHHVVPVCRGGSDGIDNLVLLCANCHAIADYLCRSHNVALAPTTRDEMLTDLRLATREPNSWLQREADRRARPLVSSGLYLLDEEESAGYAQL